MLSWGWRRVLIAAAGGDNIPKEWIDQLDTGGRLVAPVVTAGGQQSLVVIDKNKDGIEVDKSVWVSAAYWTDRVNVGMYLKKGTQVYLEGTPEAKTYTNKNNEVIPQLQIKVASLNLLSSSKTQGAGQDFLTQPNGFEANDIPSF